VNAVACLPLHRRIGDARAAIERLNTASRSWTTFAPDMAALDAAVVQADAVARSLRELRPVIAQEFAPQPPRAA
jgi:hypothetical protein